MNDRFIDMLFIVLLLLVSSIFISWSFVVEPRWNLTGDGSRPHASFLDSPLETLENFLSPASPGIENMSTELTDRLRGKVTMLVDTGAVANLAEEAASHAVSHGDVPRNLGLLRGALGAFNQSLAAAEWRIARAREDQSKSAGEIREAEEALDEMRQSAGLLSRRIGQADEAGNK